MAQRPLTLATFPERETGNAYVRLFRAVLAWMRADTQLAQPKSFAKLTGIIPE